MSCHQLSVAAPGDFAPIPPPGKLQVLLYDLVRHWLILEPGVLIQDRLDRETLDVWDP